MYYSHLHAGSLPDTWGQLQKLTLLEATNMPGLTGRIPESFSALVNLQRLYMNHAGLTGPVPTWWSRMPELHEVDLSHNSLTGGHDWQAGPGPGQQHSLDIAEQGHDCVPCLD